MVHDKARGVLGVDLGGTNIRAAAIAPDGAMLARRQTPCGAADGVDAVLERLVTTVNEAARAANLPASAPVGVAFPGGVNPRTGILSFAPNLPGWRDVPVRDRLSQLLGRPVAVGNDVNAAALGEWRYGVGQGTRHMIYLGVGTGIGGGTIIDGQLLLGRDGLASEAGHIVIDIAGPPCHCGGRGCLEAFAAGWAIARDAQRLLDAGMPSSLPDLLAERNEELDGGAIAAAALAGDGLALEVLTGAGRALGAGIASLAHLFNPEVIAIGGGVTAAGDLLFAPLHEALAVHLLAPFAAGLRIVPSALNQDAGLLGAGVLALTEEAHHE